MAICKKCGEDFEPSDYKLKVNKIVCNPCNRKYVKEWKERRKKEGRPVKSKQFSKERLSEYHKEYLKRPEVKARNAEKARIRWNDKSNKQKINARISVRRAIESGKLVREPCEGCGKTPTHGHHDDYSKPLEVRWLCKQCHTDFHNNAKVKPSHALPSTELKDPPREAFK